MEVVTPEQQDKRIAELVREKRQRGDKRGIIRLIGGSTEDLGDYAPADAGEAPKGADWK